MAGLYFDEFQIGQRFVHEIRRTVTDADNVLFSALTYNPAAIHIDHEYARTTEFGRPLINSVSAVSVGVIDGEPRLDLMYEEDVRAETDMNVVVTGTGEFVEVQGTAEGVPFRRDELDALLDLALAGCAELTRIQVEVLR